MKKQIKKFGLIILLALVASLMFSSIANAVYQIPNEFMPENTPMDFDFVGDNDKEAGTTALLAVLQIIAGALLYFAAPLAVLSITLIGFDLAMNSGNPEKIETQKKRLTWVVLGLLTIILSYGLVRIAIKFMGELFSAGTTG